MLWCRRNRQRALVGAGSLRSARSGVDDVDAHYAHARANGATITMEPKVSDYGEEYWTDKTYGVLDLEGHHWWFCQRLRG